MASGTLRKVGGNKVIEIPDEPVYGGSFSKVYFGRFDNKDVAVKRIDRFKLKTEEPQLLRSFDHENIVRYLYMDEDRENQYIVLEKCDCTLREFINDKEREIPHKSIDILKEISCGLAYLHEMRIIHRDLKPCNILLMFSGGKWRAKISDFGISKTLDANKTQVTQTSIKGTVGYHAPEILLGGKISKRADTFSLGITFFYVLSEGEHPYGSDVLKIDCDIRDGEEPNLNGLGDFEHDATTLILSMIAHQPGDRPVINEIQAHHIFWSDEKKVRYIQEVSDYCITGNNFLTMQPMLEAITEEIVGDWRESISDPVVKKVLEDMRNKRQGDGICDLLRNIRNLKNHYQEKPPEFREIVGKKSDGLAKWFTQEFPKLLPYVYEKMKCRKEDICFEEYYYMKTEANRNPQIDPSPSNTESIEELESNEFFLPVSDNWQGQIAEASPSQIVRPLSTMMPNNLSAQRMPAVTPGPLAVSQGMVPQFNSTMAQPAHFAFPQEMSPMTPRMPGNMQPPPQMMMQTNPGPLMQPAIQPVRMPQSIIFTIVILILIWLTEQIYVSTMAQAAHPSFSQGLPTPLLPLQQQAIPMAPRMSLNMQSPSQMMTQFNPMAQPAHFAFPQGM